MPTFNEIMDTTAWVYLGVTIGWTIVLAGGTGFLYYHRRLPGLQMRGLPLVFIAVWALHIYWILCMIGYIISPFAPCTAEFWIMSLLVPFGFAMFQVANSRFVDVATRQEKFARARSHSNSTVGFREKEAAPDARSWKKYITKTSKGDGINRMLVWVSLALAIEFLVTCFVYFASRKFHYSYGLFDVEIISNKTEMRVKCSKGWEWWISIAWQFFWSWIYAPYILWKSWGIRDVHGWRLQTILCCLVGLPATPMWLAALYLDAFSSINAKFIPPNWIALSCWFIQVFTIFIPCYQVFKSNTLRHDTLEAIAAWEKRNQAHGLGDADSATKVPSRYSAAVTKYSARSTMSKTSVDSRKSDMYTMKALENALRSNPEPLLQFAALKDFSGENVSFLNQLTTWKTEWESGQGAGSEEAQRKLQFHRAVRIFSSFISLEWAEFPINISSKTFHGLDIMFSAAATIVNKRRSTSSDNSATPFDFEAPPSPTSTDDAKSPIDASFGSQDLGTLGKANLESATRPVLLDGDNLYIDLDIPADFGPLAFDEAESEIKYLILTNTWPKFVNAGYSSNPSELDKVKSNNVLARLFNGSRNKGMFSRSPEHIV